jgi:hypothetical protein
VKHFKNYSAFSLNVNIVVSKNLPLRDKEVDATNTNMMSWHHFEKVSTRNTKAREPKK